jgi:SnoaL-like domain
VTTANGAALETALTWFRARTGRDLDTTMSVVADDVVCDAPGVHVEGSQGYREFEASFLSMINGATLIASFGDEDSALLMYDLATVPVPSNITAAHVRVRDGKITAVRIVYDQTPFMSLQAP